MTPPDDLDPLGQLRASMFAVEGRTIQKMECNANSMSLHLDDGTILILRASDDVLFSSRQLKL